MSKEEEEKGNVLDQNGQGEGNADVPQTKQTQSAPKKPSEKKKKAPKSKKQNQPQENNLRDSTDVNQDLGDYGDEGKKGGAGHGGGSNKEDAAKALINTVRVTIKPSPKVTLLQESISGVQTDDVLTVNRTGAGVVTGPEGSVEDASRIPYHSGGHQPSNRSEKFTEDTVRIINSTASEQIQTEFDGTKDLRTSKGAVQGYNGHKKMHMPTRGSKVYGDKPQDVFFERSIDFHLIDSTVHTTGQVLDNIRPDANYPTVKANTSTNFGSSGYTDITNPMSKSNYILKSFNFTLTDGKITKVSFNEDCIPAHITTGLTDQANFNWQVDRNNVTNTVRKLQDELGKETSEHWSPLGYVIRQPYEYNMLVHDIEAMTGALLTTAYRASASSLAYQYGNALTKDGAKPRESAVEMFLRGIGQLPHSLDKTNLGDYSVEDLVFNTEFLRKGSAAAIIAMFDSTRKYTTKARFFTSPLGLRSYIKHMENYIKPFKVKQHFIDALNASHVYSTFDGAYNPVLPVCATDKISLVNPMSLDRFLEGWSRSNITSENESGTAAIYAFKYHDLRNVQYAQVKHPVVEGLLTWMMKNEGLLARAYGRNADVTLPAFFSMLAPSMFQTMLCASVDEIAIARAKYLKEFLFAGDDIKEYIYSDLVSVGSIDLLGSPNLGISNVNHNIDIKKMTDATFNHIFWGDMFTLQNGNHDNIDEALISMPWYYCEDAFNNYHTTDYGYMKDDGTATVMSYPEVRVGVCHEYIQRVMDQDERSFRLSLDRAIGIPLPVEPLRTSRGVHYYGYADHVIEAMGSGDIDQYVSPVAIGYDNNSSGRVAVRYKNSALHTWIPTKASIMSLPRELGFIYPHLRVQPILCNIHAEEAPIVNNRPPKHACNLTFDTTGQYRMSELMSDSLSHTLVSYQSPIPDHGDVLQRAIALRQEFVAFFADRSETAVQFNQDYVRRIGVTPAVSCIFSPAENAENITFADHSIVNPYKTLGAHSTYNDPLAHSVVTLARYTWTAINRFFMPINPFENCLVANGDTVVVGGGEAVDGDGNATLVTPAQVINRGVFVDPFEGSFIFGLAGFYPSDFSQDVLNRLETFRQLGRNYTEDLFIKDSPICGSKLN